MQLQTRASSGGAKEKPARTSCTSRALVSCWCHDRGNGVEGLCSPYPIPAKSFRDLARSTAEVYTCSRHRGLARPRSSVTARCTGVLDLGSGWCRIEAALSGVWELSEVKGDNYRRRCLLVAAIAHISSALLRARFVISALLTLRCRLATHMVLTSLMVCAMTEELDDDILFRPVFWPRTHE